MKYQSTYGELKDLDQDIMKQSQSPAFFLFNKQKIGAFKQANKVRLKILADTINALMNAHIKKKEDGSFMQIIKPDGQPNLWDFQSEEAGEKFNKELEEFLSKNIEIII